MDLDVDRPRLDPLERHRRYARHHLPPPDCPRREHLQNDARKARGKLMVGQSSREELSPAATPWRKAGLPGGPALTECALALRDIRAGFELSQDLAMRFPAGFPPRDSALRRQRGPEARRRALRPACPGRFRALSMTYGEIPGRLQRQTPSLRGAKRRSNPCRRLLTAEKIAPSSARDEGWRDDQREQQRPAALDCFASLAMTAFFTPPWELRAVELKPWRALGMTGGRRHRGEGEDGGLAFRRESPPATDAPAPTPRAKRSGAAAEAIPGSARPRFRIAPRDRAERGPAVFGRPPSARKLHPNTGQRVARNPAASNVGPLR